MGASICLSSRSIAPHHSVFPFVYFRVRRSRWPIMVYVRSFSSSRWYLYGKDVLTNLETKISNANLKFPPTIFTIFLVPKQQNTTPEFLNRSAMPTHDDNNGRTSFVLCPHSLSSFLASIKYPIVFIDNTLNQNQNKSFQHDYHRNHCHRQSWRFHLRLHCT